MQQKIRNNRGQFVSAKNTFKNIEVEQPRISKPVPIVQIVMIMIVIFAILVLLDKCKVIELVSNGGF